ncbi:zinc-dependent metalloprotease [Streptomyces poonensis]|uniref:zinc-dependent metalloprotease n=1 Tax=Streptomyces poonensis TaxID=68255 RepID=UPI0016744068|nr:zinc-dependent metalloprotease [Streptomyces poonensis]
MFCTVLDDTQRNSELKESIEQLLIIVAPHVRQLTGLPAPSNEVRFRLLEPKAWRHECGQHTRRVLDRDRANLDLVLTPEQLEGADIAVKITGFLPAVIWPLFSALTVEAGDGGSETIIAPRALHHTGLVDEAPLLCQLVAHELTHHFQAVAGAPWRTLFPRERRICPRGAVTLVKGHAHWVAQQVTCRVFGRPVDHHEHAHRSLRYQLAKGVCHLPLFAGVRHDAYLRGVAFVHHVVHERGTDPINRAWNDHTLLPTADEISDPGAWIRRTAA